MSEAEKYIERLKKLNENADERTVLECIDRPIRNLVLEINRIGFKTRFSCCGFPYADEEEPKTHDRVGYIQIFEPQDAKLFPTFFKFIRDAQNAGWKPAPFAGNLWIIRNYNTQPGEYRKDDGLDLAIHDYETQLITISHLENILKSYPNYKKSFTIEDGNLDANRVMPEWQVKPKKSVKIKQEEIKNE